MASQKVHLRRCPSPSSLQRTSLVRSLLRFWAPCIWSFLRSHPFGDFLRDHQPSFFIILFYLIKFHYPTSSHQVPLIPMIISNMHPDYFTSKQGLNLLDIRRRFKYIPEKSTKMMSIFTIKAQNAFKY